MDPRIDEVERRMNELEERSRIRFEEHATRIEQIIAATLQKQADVSGEPDPKKKPGGNVMHNDGEQRLRKIDLPLFNGDDATGWLTKIERYFKVRRIEEDEKLDAAMMAVEGKALSWLQWWEANTEIWLWDELKEAILCRFQPTVVTNALELLMSMKQEGTVREHRKNFETISCHVKVQDPELFAGLFSNGLREDIRAEVRLQRPKGLAEMMEVALLAEEKIGACGKYGGRQTSTTPGNGNFKNWRSDYSNKAGNETTNSAKGPESSKIDLSNAAKSIGSKEIEEKPKKGLCFTCDEKWVCGHICKNKMLKILYVEKCGEDKTKIPRRRMKRLCGQGI